MRPPEVGFLESGKYTELDGNSKGNDNLSHPLTIICLAGAGGFHFRAAGPTFPRWLPAENVRRLIPWTEPERPVPGWKN